MVKLKSIEKIDESTFKIKVLHNRSLKTFLIFCKYHFIDSLQEEMMYFNSDNDEFYNLWGYADFRKEVSKKINQLKEAEIPELQVA